MTVKKLTVRTPQGESGSLTKEARFSFRYTSEDQSRELSLTMPLRAQDYASTNILPVFESCMPEGYLRERLTKRLLKFGKVDEMALLSAVGENGIGRLRFIDERKEKLINGSSPPSLQDVLKSGNSQELFEHLLDSYVASGISGVQPKALVPEKISGTVVQPSFIVKSTPQEYPFLAKNEFLCMEVARRAGLNVPKWFYLSDDGQLFVISRFDNETRDEKTFQLGFEDFCQLMGKTSMGKYEGSYENIVKAIHMYCGENSAEASRDLFGYLAASILMRNGDAHLKNFGLLYEHPRSAKPVLAPLYDVTTTSIYSIAGTGLRDEQMALKMNGDRRYPSLETLVRFGREKCGVNNPREVITRLAESMMSAAEEYKDLFDENFGSEFFSQWSSSLSEFDFKWSAPTCGAGFTPKREIG